MVKILRVFIIQFDKIIFNYIVIKFCARIRSSNIKFCNCDIRDEALLRKIFNENNFDLVLHLAAQVAVTTSCLDPREDFNINALGTFNLLESIRLYSPTSFFINAFRTLVKLALNPDK